MSNAEVDTAPRAVGGVRGFPEIGRTRVMGVLNVTPDSFSDGGDHLDVAAAVRHGLRLMDQGADLLDVGGESTRPGAERVSAAEELRRVLPVVAGLVAREAAVSVDTVRAEVAGAALDAGAMMINDVSGGLADPDLLPLVAARGVACVLMHWRGHSDTMQARAVYGDVTAEVCAALGARVQAALSAGVPRDLLVVDPGLGFAKTAEHNWTLLARLPALMSLGVPVLVGSSRKAFLGTLLAGPDGTPRPVRDRDDATAALSMQAAMAGVFAVRVHDVRRSADAVRVAAALAGAR